MLFPGVAVSQSVPVLTFAVKDQFDSLHTETDYRGDATVLIGSEYNGSWTKAIQDSIGSKFTDTNIKFLPVANVSSVLFFFRGFVQSKFLVARKEWMLLGWKGYIFDTYQFAKDSSSIVIIVKNGAFVYKTNGQTVDYQK